MQMYAYASDDWNINFLVILYFFWIWWAPGKERGKEFPLFIKDNCDIFLTCLHQAKLTEETQEMIQYLICVTFSYTHT